VIFQWDDQKAASNSRKHGVTFEEAASVFLDPLAHTYSDPDHSKGQSRFVTFGRSTRGRVLVVSHLDQDEDHIRIISARRATRTEAHDYQENR
jgi:uncharacterized DUF497 family protein